MTDTNALSYLDLQNAVLGSRFPERSRPNAKRWLAAAYQQVWSSADWTFKHVSRQTLTVATSTPTMPSDFANATRVYDDQGYPLEPLAQNVFEDWYTSPTVGTGRPEAYTVVNRQLIFGPAPNSSYSFQLSYRRRLAHRDTNGATVAGYFTADTDYPLWDDHHQLLVSIATMTGLKEVNDPTWYPLTDEIQKLLLDMIADYAVDVALGTTWMTSWEPWA